MLIYLEFLSKCLVSGALHIFFVEISSTEGMTEC